MGKGIAAEAKVGNLRKLANSQWPHQQPINYKESQFFHGQVEQALPPYHFRRLEPKAVNCGRDPRDAYPS